jgi:hypothetical protein
MGLRAYQVPGGVPEYTGSENWSDAAPSGVAEGGILILDAAFFLDPAAGSDSNTGRELAQSWKTFERFGAYVTQFARIDSTVTLTLAQTDLESPTLATWAELTLPQLGAAGKIVFLGTGSALVMAPFVALEHSSAARVQLPESVLPIGDQSGFTLECTAGANVGCKRSIKQVVTGDQVYLFPSIAFPNDTAGDTFRVTRPGTRFTWPEPSGDMVPLRGGGGTTDAYANVQSGVWFSNLVIEGSAAFGDGAVVHLAGVEASGISGGGAACITCTGNAVVISGIQSEPMPWLGEPSEDGLWNGWGLQQAAESERILLAFTGSLTGTLCGSSVQAFGGSAYLLGGRLRGGVGGAVLAAGATRVNITNVDCFAEDSNVIESRDGARVNIFASAPMELDADESAILRALTSGQIEVAAGAAAQFTGMSSNSYGCDSSGGGLIRWFDQPNLTGAIADLKADGFTAANAALLGSPSSLDGGTSSARIERVSTNTIARFKTAQGPNAVKDVYIHAAPGAAVQLVPAPPAGFMWAFITFHVMNNDAALATDWKIFDADGPLGGALALAAQTIAANGFSTVLYSNKAIQFQCTGAGVGCSVGGMYFLKPLPDLYIAQLLTSNVFTPVLGIVPSVPGFRTVALAHEQFDILQAHQSYPVCCSFDSATNTLFHRFTRGTATFTRNLGNNGVGATAQIGRQQIWVSPSALKIGDVFEARLNSAPVVPNSTIWRGAFNLVPELP